ncbi:hypothetical protein KC902_02160 [Candidatus Kaiserbacteria bacterium]|nr:hypothetical protein [Candidatus Kaiserbacteria bacterium]USN88798.1 MAG: hypothetical protein H6780_00020 [Candidatus Nomurabacteria bacterium]
MSTLQITGEEKMEVFTRGHRSNTFKRGSAEHTYLDYLERVARGEKGAIITFKDRSGAEAMRLALAFAYFPIGHSYLENGAPNDYRCAHCEAGHPPKKLWRRINKIPLVFACATHAALFEGRTLEDFDQSGEHTLTEGRFAGMRTSMIGYYVPAIPTEDGNYWPHNHTPDSALLWWQNLPNHS